MKFVHAADLHIDSPLRGLDRYEGAPVDHVRGATRRALENLVALCLAEDASFLLLAGDIFDGDWKDYGTGLFFVAQMARLRQAGIPVFLVRGNHDAQSQVTKHLVLPDNVHELSSRRSETRTLDTLGVAIHGQGFATRAVTEDLAVDYPAAVRGLFNIGLLHTCVQGRPGHERYAPCETELLIDKGYDYWALGHVHTREVLARAPWIVFPGNLQGRHARETGPKGATLISVSDGRVTNVEARALDVVRWTVCDVDATDVTSADDAIELARVSFERAVAEAEGRLVAAPVRLHTTARVQRTLLADAERWTQQLRAVALDVASDGLWVERVRYLVREGAEARAGDDDEAIAEIVRAIRDARDDDRALAELCGDDLEELRRKLPPEVREGDDGLRLDDPATVRRLLDDALALVAGRLGGPGGGEP